MPSPRTVLLVALLLGMELLPGFVVLIGASLLDATNASYALFWPLLGVALLGAACGSIVARRRWGLRRHRTAVIAAGAVIAGVPSLLSANGVVTFLAAFLLLGVAFWRGIAVTLEPPDYEEVQQRFAYGCGLLFFGILWVVARGIIDQAIIWHMLAAAGIAFIVVSMVALVTARVADLRAPGSGAAIVLAVLAQLGALLLLALLGLQLFALDLAGLVGHALQPAEDALGRDLSGLVNYIVDPLDRFLQLIRPHAHTGAHLTPPTQQSEEFHGKKPKYHPPLHNPIAVIGALVFVALLAAGIGYAVWRAVPRVGRRPARRRAYVEERRSLFSWGALWRSLLASLRVLFRRGTAAAGGALTAGGRRVWGPAYPADPVRRSYTQLLRRSATLGLRMPPAATPLEFERRLGARWPQLTAEIHLLTAAYVRRRYGEIAPDGEELTSVHAGWQQIRHVMKGPSAATRTIESGKALVAAAMTPPEHQRPRRPFPRADRPARRSGADELTWQPTGITLLVLSIALPVLVIVAFLIIFAVASGRLG